MSNFEWSKDEINESEISNALKQELIGEIKNVDEKTSILYRSKYTKNFKDFKTRYKKDKKQVSETFSEIKDTSIDFAKEFELNTLDTTKYIMHCTPPEELIRESIKFYTFLNDPDLTKEYMSYLMRERRHINILNMEGKNIAKIIKGRAIKVNNGDVYISLYKENILGDLTAFIHETGHMLSFKLFNDKMNPLIQFHFREFEAFLLEFIACKYVGIIYKDEEMKDNLILETLRSAYDFARRSVVQDIAAKSLLFPNDKKIKKQLIELGLNENTLPVEEYLKANYGITKDGYNSVMAAYDIYCKFENDLEKCLYEYKRFLTSSLTDVSSLYSEFGITYPYDGCKNATNAIRKLRI